MFSAPLPGSPGLSYEMGQWIRGGLMVLSVALQAILWVRCRGRWLRLLPVWLAAGVIGIAALCLLQSPYEMLFGIVCGIDSLLGSLMGIGLGHILKRKKKDL